MSTRHTGGLMRCPEAARCVAVFRRRVAAPPSARRVLGIAFLTPAGIVAFLITPLWIIAVSLYLYIYRAQLRTASIPARTAEPVETRTSA